MKKPNRIHKRLGWIAVPSIGGPGHYYVIFVNETHKQNDKPITTIPKELVDHSDDWEDLEDEEEVVTIDLINQEILNMLNLTYSHSPVSFNKINELILNFAKNYKQ
jgi:hypothetical protein